MTKTVKKSNIPKATNFGVNLKVLRRKEGLTQRAFSDLIGISRNSIASYENGLVEPNAINFLKVCEYFQHDPQLMLEAKLSDSVETAQESEEDLHKYAFASLNEFRTQNMEMSKVLEGYYEFYTMKKEARTDELHSEFYSILDDLLSLLKTLITANRQLQSDVLPEG